MRWEQPGTTVEALLARVRQVRESCREHRRALGEPVWEPPSRFEDGTLRGWRTWVLDPAEPLVPLRSFNGAPDNLWPRGVNEARCLRECSELLSPHCTCGIYAFSSPAAPDLLARLHPGTRAPALVGEVAGWGRGTIHELGWRAEFVMIRQLWVRGFEAADAADLADYYDLSVHDLDSFLCQGGAAL